MEFEGKLIKRNGSRGIIEIDGVNWFDVNKKASGKIIVEIEEKDDISNQQRRLLYALWRDYEIYTGTPLDAAEAWFKYQYMLERDLDSLPSLSRGRMSKTMATDFITYTLEYYLNNGIPFAQQDWYKGIGFIYFNNCLFPPTHFTKGARCRYSSLLVISFVSFVN